jgi:lysophospholipase L1-like esterase
LLSVAETITVVAMKRSLFLILPAAILLTAAALPQNPATDPVPRTNPANWLARHDGFVAQAKQGGIELLFLGDSITDNWRSRGKAVWDKYYGKRHAANFGIGGDRTQHVLWRIEHGELDGLSPKAIVLMIGTNNSNSDSADRIAAGVESIVHVIQEKCPDSNLLLLAVFPRNKPTDKPDQMDKIRQVNERIAKLGAERKIVFLNINGKFLGPDGKVPKEIMPDYLHPNASGYEIWAQAIEPALTEMLK